MQLSEEDFAAVARCCWWLHYAWNDRFYAYTFDYYTDAEGRRRKTKIYVHRMITS